MGTLDYGHLPPLHRRRWFWRGIWIVLGGILALGVWRYGGAAARHAKTLHHQGACLSYAASPDQVVYEDVPRLTTWKLDRSSGEERTYVDSVQEGRHSVAARPACLVSFLAAAQLNTRRKASGIAFLHELQTRRGDRRLVVIEAENVVVGRNVLGLPYTLVVPATLFRGATIAQKSHISGGRDSHSIRLFAGQADPKDRARFTIRYERDDGGGVIEGRLAEDGNSVEFRILPGPRS